MKLYPPDILPANVLPMHVLPTYILPTHVLPTHVSEQIPLKILLVENDYLLAAGTVRLLEQQAGYSVNTTDRPDDVLKQCESGQVDLVLMDATLRRMDWKGEQVSRADLSQHLKMNPKTAHIPIVLLNFSSVNFSTVNFSHQLP
jgi:CheY-like chemotaxis protein